MSKYENLKTGSLSAERFYVGTGNGLLGIEITSYLLALAAGTPLAYDLVGDVYAANGTSKILENGTDGTDAEFTGNVTGNLTGEVVGDIYADDTTSKILDSGTDGTDAFFKGTVRALDDSAIIQSFDDEGETPATSAKARINGLFTGLDNGPVLSSIDDDEEAPQSTQDAQLHCGRVTVEGAALLQSITPEENIIQARVRSLDLASIIESIANAGYVPATLSDTKIVGAICGIAGNIIISSIDNSGFAPADEDDVFIKANKIEAIDFRVDPDNERGNFFGGRLLVGDSYPFMESLTEPDKSPSASHDIKTVSAKSISFVGSTLYIGGSNGGIFGGLYRKAVYASAAVTATPTFTITVSPPVGARLLGVQLVVEDALTAGDLWDAEWNDGATLQVIATAQAVAANTKKNSMYSAIQTLIDANTDIIITKNGGGAFTLQGRIGAVAYYEWFDDLEDAIPS